MSGSLNITEITRSTGINREKNTSQLYSEIPCWDSDQVWSVALKNGHG